MRVNLSRRPKALDANNAAMKKRLRVLTTLGIAEKDVQTSHHHRPSCPTFAVSANGRARMIVRLKRSKGMVRASRPTGPSSEWSIGRSACPSARPVLLGAWDLRNEVLLDTRAGALRREISPLYCLPFVEWFHVDSHSRITRFPFLRSHPSRRLS